MTEKEKPFLWQKKYKKLGIEVDESQIEQINKKKFEENQKELANIKRRQEEHAREKEERLKELERQQREKEAAQFQEWEEQEDNFHLKQAKLRCKIRIKEGRAKPIDLLARYVDTFSDKKDDKEDDIELPPFKLVEPYLCLNGLRLNDLEDLQEDIKIYKKLDDQENLNFWNDIRIIVDDEISKLKKYQNENKTAIERRDGINPAVANEVLNIFDNKSTAELEKLQSAMEKKLNQKGTDVVYWESLLSKCKAHLAKSRLKELHQKNLAKKINQNIKLENVIDNNVEEDDNKLNEQKPAISEFNSNFNDSNRRIKEDKDQSDQLQECIKAYEDGRYSPVLLEFGSIDKDCKLFNPIEDYKELQFKRRLVLSSSLPVNKLTINESSNDNKKDESYFERIAKREMDNAKQDPDDDKYGVFRNEINIQQNLSWVDKYKPRKPRYFNRVHTGFEWNKYNQTHYDVDNPPPKIVCGYKFNIFYPDLIDKNTTPTYKLENCPESKDFKIIRFIAGPPYEDIAFKIVNREWNNSYKGGFRNQFNNNILQLWFHFKRLRYRR